MSQAQTSETNFVGYEYKDVTIHRELEPIYTDGYENFGWKLEGSGYAITNPASITLKFKRDRKMRNKAELTRLQRQFDACAGEVVALERSKTTAAATWAYVVGVVGMGFMAGAVFAYLAGMITLMVVLAVPGFAGFIVPYLLFTRMSRRKAAQVTSLIDSKYDEIYGVCEKASGLLAQA